jgi:hypothetical protein
MLFSAPVVASVLGCIVIMTLVVALLACMKRKSKPSSSTQDSKGFTPLVEVKATLPGQNRSVDNPLFGATLPEPSPPASPVKIEEPTLSAEDEERQRRREALRATRAQKRNTEQAELEAALTLIDGLDE